MNVLAFPDHALLFPPPLGGGRVGTCRQSRRGRARGAEAEPWPALSAASLVYRLPPSWVGPKLPWKVAHASLHLLAFTLTVLGLVAVFRYHSSKHIAHLYSLHSWLGITTVFFFACQVGALPSSGFPRRMAATGSAWGFAGISTKHSLAHGGGGLCRLTL